MLTASEMRVGGEYRFSPEYGSTEFAGSTFRVEIDEGKHLRIIMTDKNRPLWAQEFLLFKRAIDEGTVPIVLCGDIKNAAFKYLLNR